MPSFTIYQSEQGVRMENAQLKRDLEAARADNARLRALVGEPQVEIKAAPFRPQAGEQFEAGNCKVVIGPPTSGPPALNPMLAQARGARRPNGVPATPVRARVPQAAPAPLQFQMTEDDQVQQVQQVGQQQMGQGQQGDDGGASRFALLELDLAENVGRR